MMIVKLVAVAYYMIATVNVGTPFKGSLSDEQKRIKEQSAERRGMIYYQGVMAGVVIAAFIHFN